MGQLGSAPGGSGHLATALSVSVAGGGHKVDGLLNSTAKSIPPETSQNVKCWQLYPRYLSGSSGGKRV